MNLALIKNIWFVQIIIVILVLFFVINNTNANSAIINSVSDGNWNTGSTWDSGKAPLPTDDIIINNQLILDINVIISSPGKLTINVNSSLNGNKNVNIGAGASLINHGSINCKIFSNSGSIINNGTITTSNNINNNGTFTNNGTAIAGNNFNNNSGLLNGNDGTIISGNNVINNAGGYISGQNICNIDGVTNPLINNSGTIDSLTVSICLGPLPVELLYFKVKAEENTICVYWATASENNNDYFTIEKSIDGANFEFISYFAGAGNSSQTLHYKAVDEEPYYGLSYYRLKQTNYDGKYKYSDLVAIKFLPKLNFSINPNPANNYIEVTLEKMSKMAVIVITPEYNSSIKIYDAKGDMVYEKFNGTFYNFNIDVSFFSQGMYFVSLTANDELYKTKFVKE